MIVAGQAPRLTMCAEPATLVTLLRWRGEQHPERPAFTLLADGDARAITWTYGELERRARTIGALLRQHARPGERALLAHPPGLEFVAAFFGCLYAGLIAVPAYPPGPIRPERPSRALLGLRAIASSARPRVVLTVSDVVRTLPSVNADAPELGAARWIATDGPAADAAEVSTEPAADDDAVAALQYTSGSTARPRGVILTHRNILRSSEALRRRFRHTDQTRMVSWLPPYHDMGLIAGIVQPLYVGGRGVLLPPAAFVQRPIRWLQAISCYRGTSSAAPNFAYELCVRKVTPEQRSELDLSSWEIAACGGEPIDPRTLERFVEFFEPCGFRREAFRPGYGLAEATLGVSCGARGAQPVIRDFRWTTPDRSAVIPAPDDGAGSQVLVGCGRPLAGLEVAIVDPETCTDCSDGQVGEIWVRGSDLPPGYWGEPEETERTFRAYRADTGRGPFLRTGDLGFLDGGELFVTGRIKDVIIIRGRNHYPQDLERTVEASHPALRPGGGGAFSIEVAGEERIVVVQEIERWGRDADSAELLRAIRQAVWERHELSVAHVVLLDPGRLPKTTSGKVQRQACRAKFLAGDFASGAPGVRHRW